MGLTDLLARFDDVVEEHDGYVVTCPAHKDGRPSLRIAIGDSGSVLLHCRAGCATQAVLDSLGLTFADLRQAGEVDGQVARRATSRAVDPGIAEIAALRVYVDAAAERLQGDTADAVTALEYLQTRFGIDAETARHFGLGVDPGGSTFDYEHRGRPYLRVPRLTVPFLDFDGVARGLQARDLTGADPVRWCGLNNPTGAAWSRTAVFILDTGLSNLVITEGPSDALSAAGVGYDAIAIRGAALTNNDATIESIVEQLRDRRVVVAGDNDDAGRQFNTSLIAHLAQRGITANAIALPKDVNDLTSWRNSTDDFAQLLHDAVRNARPLADDEQPEPADDEDDADRPSHTELGNAIRVYQRSGGLIRHTPALGFLVWTGSSWRIDDRRIVKGEIQQSALDLMTEADAMPSDEEHQHEKAKAKSWAKDSQRGRNLDAVENQLKALRGVAVSASQLDAQPDLLACANGTVDLRTGKLKPADPNDLLTKTLAFNFDPNAQAPRWLQFLDEVFPGRPDMIAYLQRLVGYGITGHATEQCFVLLHGAGANGKSVFTSTLYHVFRAITANVGIETFLHSSNAEAGSGPSPDIAGLRGSRLVLTSESEHGARLAEARLKRLTGGDPVTARHLNKEPFTFFPSFLMFLSTNGLPEIRGQDDGIWRRIKVIEWTQRFEGPRRDKTLPVKLQAESEGILAWAVKGAQQWYANGLGEPPSVAAAVEGYRNESDKLRGFFPGMFEIDLRGFVARGDLYRVYEEWAASEGADRGQVWRNTTLFSALTALGVEPTKRRGTRGFHLRRVTPGDEQAAPENPALDVTETSAPSLGSIFGGSSD